MPDIPLPTIRLYDEERGEGAPILCIHGTSNSALMWEGAVEELARLGRVIAYDRRGCTRSQRPEPYPTTSVADRQVPPPYGVAGWASIQAAVSATASARGQRGV
jgi:pimeloyl-ACP methyl ester carboxylesterase